MRAPPARRSRASEHDREPAPQGLLRVALEKGAAPPAGRLARIFAWRDVMDEPLPRDEEPPRYCVRGSEVLVDLLRIEDALIVTAWPEGGAIEVEDRLCFTERALAAAIATERALVGSVLDHAQEASGRAAESGLRKARRMQRDGNPVAPLLVALVTVLHRTWTWMLRGLRGLSRGIATMPDRIGQSARRASLSLSTKEGRRQLWRALRDPQSVHGEQKAIALFVGTTTLLATLLLAHLFVTLALPRIAVLWRAGILLFGYGYVTSVGIPLPWEPALIAGALTLGPLVAIGIAITAKLAAGYMVFFLGDEVNEKLEERAARSPWFERFLRGSERFAQRFGVFAMALFIAAPGLPDAVALYVFGSLGMSVRRYLLGIALGALVLDLIVVYGGMRLLHLG